MLPYVNIYGNSFKSFTRFSKASITKNTVSSTTQKTLFKNAMFFIGNVYMCVYIYVCVYTFMIEINTYTGT